MRNTISGKGQILNAKEPHKAAWELVCLPKKERELGVINLQTHNAALLLKILNRFSTDKTSHGCTRFGNPIIMMDLYHPIRKKASSGGKIF